MKKILAIFIVFAMLLSVLCGCKEKKAARGDTLLFDYKDFSKYIDVVDYKNYTLDTNEADFQKALDDFRKSDLENAGLTEKTEVASGNVEDGDTVHITYVGRMNGEEFSGGTSGDEGTDLTIGSNSFIDGFESGLIGAKVGSTVVLNLKFPDPYVNNPDYSGKDVEFTVDVQSLSRTTYPEITDDVALSLGFESAAKYEENALDETKSNYLIEKLSDECKVLKYPQKELDYYVDSDVDYYTQLAANQGATFDDFLNSYNLTEATFRSQIEESYKNTMSRYLFIYYIARTEKLLASEKEISAKYEEISQNYSVTVDEVKEQYEEAQIEFAILYDKVTDYLKKTVKTK